MTICEHVPLTTLQVQFWRGGQDQRTHQADWQPGSTNCPTLVTSCYYSNYLDPQRRTEECQRSSHYLSAIYRSERNVERDTNTKDMRQPSFKSIYRAEISLQLSRAIIPLFCCSVSQDDPISNLEICLPPPVCLSICQWTPWQQSLKSEPKCIK